MSENEGKDLQPKFDPKKYDLDRYCAGQWVDVRNQLTPCIETHHKICCSYPIDLQSSPGVKKCEYQLRPHLWFKRNI